MVRFIWAMWPVILSVAVLAANEVFIKFSTDDGLSENTVQVIHQDYLGFMWFGTEYGLNQFDGYRFKPYHFNTSDSAGYGDNIIRAIIEDRRGRLWVGTAAGGLYLYDRFGDSFEHCRHQPFSIDVSESVYCMAEDGSGRIWIGSQNGLEMFDPQTRLFSLYPHWPRLTKAFDSVAINALALQGADTLWIGTANDGLWRLQISSGECRIFQYRAGIADGISHNRISDMVMDSRKRLWIAGYGGGLNLFDQQRWYAFKGAAPFGIGDANLFKVFLDDKENLFVGTEREGLYIADLWQFQPLRPQFRHISQDKNNVQGLGSNNIRAVYKDRQNNLWIGFFKGGVQLSAANRKQFEHFNSEMNNPNSLSNNLVNEIFEDSRGEIWIGTDGGGLNRFDPAAKRFTVYRREPTRAGSLIHDHVLSVLEAKDRLWIGTWGGLAQFDPRSGVFTSFAHAQAKDPSLNNIFRLFADARGDIWICTYGGLELFDPSTRRFTTVSVPSASRLTSNWVLAGMQDRNGDVWIGTREGLNRLRKSDWQARDYHFSFYLHRGSDSKNLRAQVVQTVIETSDGELLAGTLDGLFRYVAERDAFEAVRTQDGSLIKGIFRILEDEQHNLWISTMDGLVKLEPSGRSIAFDKSDGLQSNEFTFGACKTASGQLYFGGVNGFNRFYPHEIVRNESPPAVVLTDFRLFNRSTPISAVMNRPDAGDQGLAVTLKPRQNVFAFEFAALDYANPAKCRYAYRMEGLDADWTFTDATQRQAAYRNLPAGRFTFHVRAANGDGVWNDDGLRISLRVIPPFWKSNGALLLYVMAAGGILLVLRTVIVAKTHYDAELRLDQMKLNFFTNIAHEFRTPLTLILGPAAKILDAGERLSAGKRQFYRAIMARNAKRLQHLIGQVMDLQKLEKGGLELARAPLEVRRFAENIVESFTFLAESRRIALRFHCRQSELPAFWDADKVEKILYNLISNALNYTPAGGQIIVEIDKTSSPPSLQKRPQKGKTRPLGREWIKVVVADTGSGISPKHLDHIFERFYRGDHESAFGRTGTGVGLALAKQLAELHGGTLSVQSELGRGSIFTLWLPVGEIAGGAERVAESVGDHTLILPHENAAAGDKPQILIIEDDPDMRLFIAHELSPDYAVTAASDGPQGIAVAQEAVPDLIICDVMMPEMSGFDVCRTLKADQRTGHIPVILLTARAEEAAHLQGLQQGADDYIIKPFDAELLRARIANLLENRRRLQEQFSRKIFLEPAQIKVTSAEAQFMQKVLESVERHMDDESFSVDLLAHEIGLSRAQLYRKVQALVGQTPQELITGLRLQRAARLLTGGQFTVAEIAYRTGFSDPAHFSKSFKKRFGCPPSHYKS